MSGDDSQSAIELSPEDMPVLRNLGNGLLVAYFVDLGNAFEWVQRRQLDRDGINETQLHDIGIENLKGLSANLRVQPYTNIFAVLLDGNFEASLILLDDLWDGTFRRFVSGDYAIAIPARDILAFCDATSAAGLDDLRGVIQRLQVAGADHPITNQLYVRRSGTWHVL